MKIVAVADAYITCEMMNEALCPYIGEEDTLTVLFFGEKDRTNMRDTVKAIESGNRQKLSIPKDLHKECGDADVLLVHLCPVNEDLLENAKNLKAILSCRGGVENIAVDKATEKGIIVSSNPAHNANAVAEYTIGLILNETRNISRADRSLKEGVWREKFPNTETPIRELCDMTLGIIGYGSVGRLVAEKISVFGTKTIIYDPFIDESAYDLINHEFVDLDTLLERSDIISLHARSRDYILDFPQFEKMKKDVYLINTARSNLISPKALQNALETHQILGAAIDVFESEPNIPAFYRKYDNITITNHRGGDTINSYKDSPKFAIKNYMNYLKKKDLKFWVNKKELKKQ